MEPGVVLETPRLLLRHWRPEDREPFAQLNADPEVMRYFPATLTPAESDAVAGRIQENLAARGWGLYAAELRDACCFAYAFTALGLPDLVSYTAAVNAPSRRVMEKLGMTHDPADDFENPRYPEGHPFRPHVVYRLRPGGGTSAEADV